MTLGITGGIGSGKSVVSKILRLKKIPVYDADSEAKRLMVEDVELVEGLKKILGDEAYTPEGQVDRKYVAAKIFNAKELLLAVNSLVHPAVGRDFSEWVKLQALKGVPLVAFESAILFESGMRRGVDKTVLVTAPEELRVQRVVARDVVTEVQVRARMANQMSETEKKKHSDIVIENDGKKALLPQINQMLAQLIKENYN